jgi:epoxyqueuosine reductase
MTISAQAVKSRAVELGFNLVGVTPAIPSPRLDAYERWIAQHMHGEMGYMAREDRVARRRDLNVILPGVRSLIVVGLDYHALSVPDDILNDPGRGRIAAYAWGLDYHDLIAPRLETLAASTSIRARSWNAAMRSRPGWASPAKTLCSSIHAGAASSSWASC